MILDDKHGSIESLITAIQNHAPLTIRGNIMGLGEKIYLQGEERGAAQREAQIAKDVLIAGVDVEFVAKITKLSPSTIKNLKSELNELVI